LSVKFIFKFYRQNQSLITDYQSPIMKPILLVICTLTLLSACTKSIKKMFKTVENAQIIQLFAIEDFATAPEVQTATETYILDYKILNQISLSDSQQVIIKTYVSNLENYTENVARTCPFFAKYGLSFSENGKVTTMIIGTENCPKCMVSGDGLENGKILDFLDGGFVESLSAY